MARVIARTADNRAARGRLRQTLGALADLRLVRVKKRYDRALRLFFAFLTDTSLELPNDGEALDEVLSMYIEHLWESGDPKYMAADCLAALRKMAPMTGGLYHTETVFSTHLTLSTIYSLLISVVAVTVTNKSISL